MAALSSRSMVYKVVLILIYLTFLIFGLSLGNPFWYGPNDEIIGLWTVVDGDDFEVDSSNAYFFGEGDAEDWFEGVRACWVAGTFFYIVGIISSLVENCRETRGKDYGVTGVLVLLAGLSGAAGVIVLIIKIHDKDDINTYRWGFYIACISAGLAIIFAVILLLSRNVNYEDDSKATRTADYVYAHKHPTPYAMDYTNQGYRNDELPLVNGVSHSLYRGGNGFTNGYGNGYPPAQRAEPNTGYNPYAYKAGNRSSMADSSADLSNGFTSEMIQTEQSLGRRRDDFSRYGGGGYHPQSVPRQEPPPHSRNDFYYGRGF